MFERNQNWDHKEGYNTGILPLEVYTTREWSGFKHPSLTYIKNLRTRSREAICGEI
jgi:hypothetical protein